MGIFSKDPAKEAKKLGLTLPLYEELQADLTRRKGLKPRPILSELEVIDAYQQVAKSPAVIVRQYRQLGATGASKRFDEDAQILAAHGYLPASQSFNNAGFMGLHTAGGFLIVSYARRDLQAPAN